MDLLGLSPTAWMVAIAIVVAGSMLQSTTGFGLALVSAPVLVLLDPTLVPGVVLAVATPLAMVMLIRERAHLDLNAIRWALLGRVLGAFGGSWAVLVLGTRDLSIAFALSLLLAVAMSVAGFSLANLTPGAMLGAGFASGVTGTATSVGGPIMALALQHESGPRLRTMMASFMAFGGMASLTLLTLIGEFGRREATLGLFLAPVSLIGIVLSCWTVHLFDRDHTRPTVLTFATVAAIIILIRAL